MVELFGGGGPVESYGAKSRLRPISASLILRQSERFSARHNRTLGNKLIALNRCGSSHKGEEPTIKPGAKLRGWFPSQPQQTLAAIGLVIALFASGAASGGVLSEGDFKQAENLKLLFANLMNDLVATVNRPDVASGDLSCVNSTIRELVQISDELASYEYLITMEKQMADVGDDSPMRDVVKFAIEKSNMILTEERKRLAQVSDQCAKYPLGYGKIQQALQVIDTTTSILASIRSHV